MVLTFLRKVINKNYTLYPILIGILFIVNQLRVKYYYYYYDAPGEVLSLIAVILIFCTLSYLIANILIKDKFRAGIIATLFISVNIFYLDIIKRLMRANIFGAWFFENISKHTWRDMHIVIVVSFVLLVIIILKSKQNLGLLNAYLNVIFIIYICLEITKFIFIHQAEIKLVDSFPLPDKTISGSSNKPNIYFIILDSYTSNSSLKQYWDYDNTPFEDSLKYRGFFVTHNSRSKYNNTPYSICSYLNFSSLTINDTIPDKEEAKLYSNNTHYFLISNNQITKFLRSQGYSIVNYSPFTIEGTPKHYKIYNHHYLSRTLWYTIYMYFKEGLLDTPIVSSARIPIFNVLRKYPNEKYIPPFFVYAHILLPHGPFYLDENGSKLTNEDNKLPDKIKYLKQLIYTNKITTSTIDSILSNSDSEPIIIIQGDHGFRDLANNSSNKSESEAYTMFSAYHLPGKGVELLNDSISPINTFRVILNAYFGQKLPLYISH